MTARAANTREHVAPLASFSGHFERRGRCEHSDERGCEFGLAVAQLWIRSWVGPRGHRRPRDSFLSRHGGRRDALFRAEGPIVELAKSWHQGFPSETPEAAVEEAVGPSRDAIMVAVIGICVGQDLGIGNGIEQAEAKNLRDRAPSHCSRRGGDRLALDAEGWVQGWGDAVLKDKT